jgi:hypothetical protein
VQHDHNVTIATLTDEQLFAIASGRASKIQVIEHEPAPGLGTGFGGRAQRVANTSMISVSVRRIEHPPNGTQYHIMM